MHVHSTQNIPQQSRALYVSVNTYDPSGNQIGSRVVDMYHYGTRSWLANHTWWAMHNGHTVEQMLADESEIDAYLEKAIYGSQRASKAA